MYCEPPKTPLFATIVALQTCVRSPRACAVQVGAVVAVARLAVPSPALFCARASKV